MIQIIEAVVAIALCILGGGGVAWFTLQHVNAKTDADAAEVITKAAASTVALQNESIARILADVAQLRAEVQSLRVEAAAKNARIIALEDHLGLLEDVVRQLGGHVPPRPAAVQI